MMHSDAPVPGRLLGETPDIGNVWRLPGRKLPADNKLRPAVLSAAPVLAYLSARWRPELSWRKTIEYEA